MYRLLSDNRIRFDGQHPKSIRRTKPEPGVFDRNDHASILQDIDIDYKTKNKGKEDQFVIRCIINYLKYFHFSFALN
jgi:hypothetical protein